MAEIRTWWELHVRVARGEHLDGLEAEVYTHELARLNREELVALEKGSLKRERAIIRDLEREQARLRERCEALDAEINALEPLISDASSGGSGESLVKAARSEAIDGKERR